MSRTTRLRRPAYGSGRVSKTFRRRATARVRSAAGEARDVAGRLPRRTQRRTPWQRGRRQLTAQGSRRDGGVMSAAAENPRVPATAPQSATPYADAVRAYAGRPYVRLDVPGHAGDAVAQPELAEVLGSHVLGLDVPPLVSGID